MLAWVLNTYSGHDLMGHSELNVERAKIGPLLSSAVLTKLQDQYLKVIYYLHTEFMELLQFELNFYLEHGKEL